MSKCVLAMDMPTLCHKCPLCTYHNVWYCEAVNKKIPYMTEKPSWCPLREVPDKKEYYDEEVDYCDWEDGYKRGYNACIDKILGDSND